MTYARSLLVPADAPGFYHCISRCVRRAWLCGTDSYTGRCFEHRRQWVEDRLHALASIFAVALYGYAVMSNHLHVVLHVDPETARLWTDDEIARRWCALFPVSADDAQARRNQHEALLARPERLALCRQRLASLSWFMRCLSEPIARRANREDECTGRFWEGRYRCQALLDERAVLGAMTYVDLNPIRAGITKRLDRSRHTAIAKRIASLAKDPTAGAASLAPIAGGTGIRHLNIRSAHYIQLVDWTGRQLRPGKRGVIPGIEPAALKCLGLDSQGWTTHVRGVGSGYWRAIGAVQQLLDKAASMQQRWLKGIGLARMLAPG